MEITVLNSTSRVNPQVNPEEFQRLNSTSRVNPVVSPEEFQRLNALPTAADYMAMNGYTINGYTINGYTINALAQMDEIDYQLIRALVLEGMQNDTEMNALSLAAIGAAAKKVGQTVKKGVQFVKGGVQSVRTGGATLKTPDEIAAMRAAGLTGEFSDQQQVQRFDQFQADLAAEMEDIDAQQRIFGGTPSLFKSPGKWFSSKKVPTWQKAGVVLGGVVLVDALTGGNIILKRAGIMKAKKRK